MEVQKLKLSEIAPAPYNPRKELTPDDAQYKKIRRSLQEFGCVEPLIYNKRTGHLVSGHQRVTVLKDLGQKEIEAVIIDIDEKDEKKLNVMLNRARGRWDDEKLADILRELDEKGGVELTGFDEWELQGILEDYDQIDNILQFDPDPPQEAQDDEDAMISMVFAIPKEYADAAEEFLDSVEDAEMILSTAVIEMIKEAG